ncbi:hypothetical protein [Alcaligenes aquatilis]|uniref:hypothetical protein n=1 Tax=Alcaligenes aquatilis TaxID=323284 RepID=UPI003F939318
MQKEKCACEWQMLATLFVGLAIGLIAGIAIGWNGARYPSETNFILSFLTAVGTVGAAFGAVYAAFISLGLSKKEINRANEEKQKYIDTQVHVLSEWGNRAANSLRKLQAKLREVKKTPSSWRESDCKAVRRNLESLKVDSLALRLERVHEFQNGEAWVFCISRAATLYAEIQDRLEGGLVWDGNGLSDYLLHDYIDEMLHVLSQISINFIWHEYDDSA